MQRLRSPGDAWMHSGAFSVPLLNTIEPQPFSIVIYKIIIHKIRYLRSVFDAPTWTCTTQTPVSEWNQHENGSQQFGFIYLYDSAHEFILCNVVMCICVFYVIRNMNGCRAHCVIGQLAEIAADRSYFSYFNLFLSHSSSAISFRLSRLHRPIQ